MKWPIQFLIMCLGLTALPCYALPCPNGSGIYTHGDTTEVVLSACGQPNVISTDKKTVTIVEKWEYYKTPMPNQNNTKIEIIFKNNVVVNIAALGNNNSNNFSSTTICGSFIKTGDSTQTVLMACGQPLIRQVVQQDTIPIVTFTYTKSNGNASTILTFENNRLIAW